MADDTRPTGVLAMADGTVVYGHGFGAEGSAVGEVCFNTAMTGYQEVMTDPSYAAQIVAFTFPHIGNVGANREDEESGNPHAVGCVVREAVTRESNWRARRLERLDACERAHRIVGGRYKSADEAHPRAGRAQRGDRAFGDGGVRRRRAGGAGARVAGVGGDGPGQAGVDVADVQVE